MREPKVIVALDFADAAPALALVERLDPRDCALKVGKEMFVASGPEPVRWMVSRGFRVFLDLKFHDIPNTVAHACAAAARLGVWMIDVHAAGGRAMLTAASRSVASTAAQQQISKPLLVGVTVLTSLRPSELAEVGVHDATETQSLRLARLSAECGLDGVVCSALEAGAIRTALGAQFKLVTPGIRPAGAQANDQARVMTPQQAITRGADYLVIGRPITQARDPTSALAEINASLDAPPRI